MCNGLDGGRINMAGIPRLGWYLIHSAKTRRMLCVRNNASLRLDAFFSSWRSYRKPHRFLCFYLNTVPKPIRNSVFPVFRGLGRPASFPRCPGVSRFGAVIVTLTGRDLVILIFPPLFRLFRERRRRMRKKPSLFCSPNKQYGKEAKRAAGIQNDESTYRVTARMLRFLSSRTVSRTVDRFCRPGDCVFYLRQKS